MTPFECIALLDSIVIALRISRILTALGQILRLRGSIRLYWIHVLWMANVFLWLLLNWWILYRWRTFEQRAFLLFTLVLVSPAVAFPLSVLLVPEPREKATDLRRHFFDNRRWFFLLAAVLPPVDAVDALLKGRVHFMAQGLI